ncbi:MAG: MBL fold metallo-hydrolase [Promicromonosporaceae bacterium]|nr:MBL fold metallo-hydrolase [Promicromonosporaceae bacterium]
MVSRRFRTTTHPTAPAKIGTPVTAADMEALLAQPGPITLTTVGVDWVSNLSGLLNLKHPVAVAAGLKNRKEPIKVYLYLVRHPERGLFLVDTGVSERFAREPASVGVGWALRAAANVAAMRPEPSTAQVLSTAAEPLQGVFLTHLHFDHISGLPDIPVNVPLYTGPGEAGTSVTLNLLAQGTTNRLLRGRPPLQELQIPSNPEGALDGVLDVFDDGSFFAILNPGHTAGHLAFVIRSTYGPILLTGDTSHLRWGWDNEVEPGSFLSNRDKARRSLLALKALAGRHPNMQVRLGHQP